MPYMYPDLECSQRSGKCRGSLCDASCSSPIGSNKGICTKEFIQILIDEIDLPIIVDAGIGRPSQACEAMEMGAVSSDGQYCYCDGRRCSRLWLKRLKRQLRQEESAYLSGLRKNTG